eukprot:CAMPEP_0174839194 /NCGR_PEP_ID=MMETSP1114-20130205/7881_1 /TAXON_ID=312471 /ORGANISM="Neobodo designis, Strain CCAP 1951/1" /LENGTH=413 /DNA_ID=CAMNT_0016073315 /DNA_START=49 /DNA_END=1287 /DNA_ORIENTATION=-
MLRRTVAAAGVRGALAVGASRRAFHGIPDERRITMLKSSMMTVNKLRGRDVQSDLFETKEHLVCAVDGHGEIFRNATANTCIVDLVGANEVDTGVIAHPAAFPYHSEHAVTNYDKDMIKHMRGNADAWGMTYAKDGPSVIHLIDPNVNHRMYKREEAQVEMIAAYRNALYEFWYLSVKQRKAMDVLRIPALCLYTSDRFQDDIGKLNQQALLKGYHRCAQHVKDWYSLNERVRVEIYIPPEFMPQFEKAWSEDAWLPPTSTIDPGRTQLYSGAPVPRQMLEYDGWVGKRPEIEASVETDGRSIEEARESADPKMLQKAREARFLPPSSKPVQVRRRGGSSSDPAKTKKKKFEGPDYTHRKPMDADGNVIEDIGTDFTPNPIVQARVAEAHRQRLEREAAASFWTEGAGGSAAK